MSRAGGGTGRSPRGQVSASQGEESPGDGAGDGGNRPEVPEPPGGRPGLCSVRLTPVFYKAGSASVFLLEGGPQPQAWAQAEEISWSFIPRLYAAALYLGCI